jgi:hypothetical protein
MLNYENKIYYIFNKTGIPINSLYRLSEIDVDWMLETLRCNEFVSSNNTFTNRLLH